MCKISYAAIISFFLKLLYDIEEKKLGLAILMKTQTGKDFDIDDKMANVVSVIKVKVPEYTANEPSSISATP